MNDDQNIKVKICCISSPSEAEMAINAGATAIGLVGPMPSGPGIISDQLIKQIAAITPDSISTFLLTSETNADRIIEHHQKVNTTFIQMVDKLAVGSYSDIRQALPDVKLVQVIHVLNEASITEAIDVSKQVDYLLLDSGNPNLKTKVLGGTGQTHNWTLSKRIVEKVQIPCYLAGGLNSQNIKEAIAYVQPYGVDLCSGVRTDQKLDAVKLEEFFVAVHSISK